jgi:hypothetical protein
MELFQHRPMDSFDISGIEPLFCITSDLKALLYECSHLI